MNESKLQVDEFLLDELAMGNLNDEQYRQVLLTLEAKPHLWRQCAYAFLREQALTADLKSIAAGDIDWSLESGKVQQLTQPGGSGAAAASGTHRNDPNWRFTGLQQWAAVAALLLVSFSIGWMGAGLQTQRSESGGPAHSQQASAIPGLSSPSAAPQSAPDFNRRLPAAPSPTMLASDRFLPIDLQIPASLRELERAGRIRIETVDAIMPVELEDGSSAIVPIQQYRVVPVIYSY